MTATGFCPQCGTQRQGSLRYCASCGFDYWKFASEAKPAPASGSAVPTSAAPAQTTLAGPPPPSRGRSLGFIAAGVLLLVIAGIAIAIVASKPPGVGSTATNSPTATPTASSIFPQCTSDQHLEQIGEVWECITTVATPSVIAGPLTVAVGEPVPMECSGDPCMDVTVAKVTFATRYRDPDGYYDDKPSTAGYVFMAVYVTYKATGPKADYNEFDWAIYVNDVAGQSSTYVSHGPTPELQSGQLPVGKSAVGWIVYEVPAKGKVTISYQPGLTSIFEVELRAG